MERILKRVRATDRILVVARAAHIILLVGAEGFASQAPNGLKIIFLG